MSSIRGLVTDTIEFSAVDGPGNRFVVFLQGCGFDCIACHNPSTINVCVDCGDCVPACPSGALRIDEAGHIQWDERACRGSERCIEACPHDSTPKARHLGVAALLEQIHRAAPFLSGVTVSGGEATMQVPFVRALFAAIRADQKLSRLTCFIDTNGDASSDVWEMLAPVMDAAMVDLKCLDPQIHLQLTGQPNERVLASIRHLHDLGRLYEVRLLILPGLNDGDALLERTAAWLADIDPHMRLKVIGLRRHGVRPSPVTLREPAAGERSHYRDVVAQVGDFAITVV